MPDSLWPTLGLLSSGIGIAWLALAMDVHWQQALGGAPPARRFTVVALRLGGAGALAASLLFCLRADHPSMAALVWVMSLAAAALAVALTLAWWPRGLSVLVPWAKRRARRTPSDGTSVTGVQTSKNTVSPSPCSRMSKR